MDRSTSDPMPVYKETVENMPNGMCQARALGHNDQPVKPKPDEATLIPVDHESSAISEQIRSLNKAMSQRIHTAHILGKEYQVVFKGANDNMTLLGSIEYAKQRIFIFDELPYDQRCETFLHETIHAVNEELKLGLSEVTVARLAVGLHSAGYHIDPSTL